LDRNKPEREEEKMRTELKPKEKLIHEFRLHWLVLLKPVFMFLLFVVATLIAFNFSVETGKVLLLITIIPLLVLVWKILDRRFNIWAVTTLRIIDESGVLSSNSKESPLDKINNISFHQSFVGRIFGYGDVQIQTAAEMGATTYSFIESPKLLKDTVTKYQENYRQLQITEQAEKLANAIKGNSEPTGDTKECPYCAETIKANAKFCRFCQKNLGTGKFSV
jgi:uncharacterized membrane protein YdbT with pleckstrin-like domain